MNYEFIWCPQYDGRWAQSDKWQSEAEAAPMRTRCWSSHRWRHVRPGLGRGNGTDYWSWLCCICTYSLNWMVSIWWKEGGSKVINLLHISANCKPLWWLSHFRLKKCHHLLQSRLAKHFCGCFFLMNMTSYFCNHMVITIVKPFYICTFWLTYTASGIFVFKELACLKVHPL